MQGRAGKTERDLVAHMNWRSNALFMAAGPPGRLRMPRTPPLPSPGDPPWRAGMTLGERLAAMNSARGGDRPVRPIKPHRILRWRAERQAEIAQVDKLAAIPGRAPRWWRTFEAACTKAVQRKASGSRSAGILAAAEPVLADARRRVAAALQASLPGTCPAADGDRVALTASLELGLRQRLFDVLSRSLALELAVARRRGVLIGKTSEERFAFFCDCLADPELARRLLMQYPVLVRRVVAMANAWETATLALLSHLSGSRQALRSRFFGGDDPGPLASIETRGDTHGGGQAVCILTFKAGNRLVYKPRSVAMESCFFDLVGWLNRRGCDPSLKEVRVLDHGGFGWMEFVEAKPCHAEDEVERFFARQGGQIALAYVLGGTDFHFENVIPHGEYPVLVDLETLFRSPLLPGELVGATGCAWRALRMSVMGTVLLPQQMFMAEDGQWTDLSALGNRDGQLTPFRVPVWRGDGTDRMRLVHERIPMSGGTALPEHGNARAQASGYAGHVAAGFDRMYEFLQRRKAELLADQGPLARCLGKPVRHVFRSTAWYGQLLAASHHPRFLTDALACEALLHNRLRAASAGAPWLAAIEDAEVASLLACEIPYFVSRVGEGTIVSASDGANRLLASDGWRECRDRIQAMSELDRERQNWMVRVALADLSAPADRTPPRRPRLSRNPTRVRLISTATEIGQRICELAVRDGERATWLIPVVADERRLVTTVAGLDLYSGLPGIALFLGQLGGITGVAKFRRLAVAAMAEALALHRACDRDASPVGAFEGTGGLAYAMVQLAELAHHPEWVGSAIGMLRDDVGRATRGSHLDLIAGKAGFMVAALAVQRHTGDAGLLRSLQPLARRLRRHAVAPRNGEPPSLPADADAGVAHGRSGIGFALARWAEATGADDFRASAAELIRFDLETIDAMRARSLPHEASPRRNASAIGWCRGWLGAALVALRAAPHAMAIGPDWPAWFQRIADEIVHSGVEGPLCLCHGAVGQMDFLQTASERGVLRNPKAAAAWRRGLMARVMNGEWVADEGHSLESPSLMVGLAGTGHALLRAAHPQRIPSVLTLELS